MLRDNACYPADSVSESCLSTAGCKDLRIVLAPPAGACTIILIARWNSQVAQDAHDVWIGGFESPRATNFMGMHWFRLYVQTRLVSERNDKAGLYKSPSKQTNGNDNIVSFRGRATSNGAVALAA